MEDAPHSDAEMATSTVEMAFELCFTMKLNRVLAALVAEDRDEAISNLKTAFDIAKGDSTNNHEVSIARCKFWEGMLYATFDDPEVACQCLLGSLALLKTRPFEGEQIQRYLKSHRDRCSEVIRLQMGGDDEAARQTEKSLFAMLSSSDTHKATEISSDPEYPELINSPIVRASSYDQPPVSETSSRTSRWLRSQRQMIIIDDKFPKTSAPHQDIVGQSKVNAPGIDMFNETIVAWDSKPCSPTSTESSLFQKLQGDVRNVGNHAVTRRSLHYDMLTDLDHFPSSPTGQIDQLMYRLRNCPVPEKPTTSAGTNHTSSKEFQSNDRSCCELSVGAADISNTTTPGGMASNCRDTENYYCSTENLSVTPLRLRKPDRETSFEGRGSCLPQPLNFRKAKTAKQVTSAAGCTATREPNSSGDMDAFTSVNITPRQG